MFLEVVDSLRSFFKLLNVRNLKQAGTQLNTDLLAFLAIGPGFEIQSTHQFPQPPIGGFIVLKVVRTPCELSSELRTEHILGQNWTGKGSLGE